MVNLVKHDLEFILKQIKIAEAHAGGEDLAKLVAEAGGVDPNAAPGAALQPHLLPYGLRTVDGSYNNLIDGREEWGAAAQPFVPLVEPNHINEGDDALMFGTPNNPVWLTNNNYASNPGTPSGSPMLPNGTVVDADPRLISNLIVDQTSNNPAAVEVYNAMVLEGKATATPMLTPQGTPVLHTADVLGFNGEVLVTAGSPVMSYTFENISPDIGDSAPYNSMFTLFGQFFDHGLDLVQKGGNGTVYIPLSPDDPLYVEGSHSNFMVLTRVSTNATNVTTPWVDQNQTYTSHASHQTFLREYTLHEGKPVATGHLLEGKNGGLATWADVKEQALMLGIQLTDADVGKVPLLRTDAYGNFIPNSQGYAQLIVGIGADNTPNTADDIVVSGTPTAPVNPTTAGAIRTPNAFLDDIAHAAVPVVAGGVLQADGDNGVGYFNADGTAGGINSRGQQTHYDNEMLDAHYITGDGRGNENIGLTAIHHVFHSEHNSIVEQTKEVVLESGDLAFINQWLLKPIASLAEIDTAAEIDALVWDGERLFQVGRFTNEMEYQHLVFEEFGRKMQPDIDAFLFEPSADINPAIFAEFAHAVYRFGHSMLNESIDRIDINGNSFDITLFEGFLNPLAMVGSSGSSVLDHDVASGAIIRGMSRQAGNEIDEFVTNVLRNQLVGIPLDLAAINIARGRDVGLPTLNEARAQFYAMAGNDSQLKPYTSWVDFALNINNPASIVNFIAAYGTHESITSATTLDAKRAAAAALVLGVGTVPPDRLDFLKSTGTWANKETGLGNIDLWIGGLAEKKMDFGGMLGSTFSFVFELQMENLQEADRFYYLSRVQGLNLLNELENNSLSEIIMRNTNLGDEHSSALPGDIFSTPDFTLEVDKSRQIGADPTHSDPILNALTPLVVRLDTDGDGDTDILVYHGGDHVVMGGTEEDDIITAGEGDDTIWGRGGNDTLEGGYGVDKIFGGKGDDIITNAGTDIGAADFLHGNEGNDVIHGGSGLGLIFGNEGQDFIIGGPDGKHILGGLDNDFIAGGDGGDFLMGNEGHDWIEGGGRFDTLAGDNSDLFFNSTIIGHDVLNGNGSDTDYDAESGDDIMFQNEGIQRSNGMAGFDWAIHKGDTVAANSDLGIPIFDTQEAFILRDRFDLVEGLSGWDKNDVLTGRNNATNARAELQNTAAIPGPDSPIDSFSNALLQKNVALIDGLASLVAHLTRIPVVDANGQPVLDANGVQEQIVLDTADASDILLGGGGSDIIKGLAGNDIIDGDRWLNVRIQFTINNVAYTADGMTTKVYLSSDLVNGKLVDGALAQFGGRTLDALMFTRTVNPGQLSIVREIVDGDVGNTAEDIAVFSDVFANYTITRNADGSITVDHTGFDEDAVNPDDEETAPRPVSDGTDRLFNIEVLRFADQDVRFTPPELFLNGPTTANYADNFDNRGWGNSTGNVNWGPDWVETGDNGGGIAAGQIRIDESQLLIFSTNVLRFHGGSSSDGATITRDLNLSGRQSATITYSANPDSMEAGENVRVEFAADGVNFVLLNEITGNGAETDYSHTANGPFSAAAKIRFVASAMNDANDIVSIDNLSISYQTAPATVNYETTFTEDGNEQAIARSPVIVEDSNRIVSARVVLTNAQASDVLSAPTNLPGNITRVIDTTVPGIITMILTTTTVGGETLATFQSAIAQIEFENTSQNPSTIDRIIHVTVSDGVSDSNIAVTTMNVVAVNDPTNAQNDTVITNIARGNAIVIPEWALLANDIDPDSAISFTSVGGANGLTGLSRSNGSVSVTDPTTGNSGGTFNYVATGSTNDTAQVSISNDTTGNVDGNNNNNILIGDAASSTFDAGGGNDIVFAGAGNDTIVWNVGDGRDYVDGGTNGAVGDTFRVNGSNFAETFVVYARAAADAAGIAGLKPGTQIVVVRDGQVIAELTGIEELIIDTNGGNDQVTVIGNLAPTDLSEETITVNGSTGNDTVDITALASAHRILFRTNGGNDTIVGTLRPQDVVELPAGMTSADYDIEIDENGVTTMTSGEHTICFVAPEGLPQFSDHHDDEHEDEEHDEDDNGHDGEDDDCSTDDDDEEPQAPANPGSSHAIMGTSLDDLLTGTSGADLIFGLAGNDYILAGAAADIIRAEAGNDFVHGEEGRDIIFGGDGDDDLFGGDGADMIYGDAGNDRLFGENGDDLLTGGLGNDTIFGGEGNDLMVAGIDDGNDTYDGGSGIDTLDYGSLTADLSVNLGTGVNGRGSVTGTQSGTDTLYGIENITTGSGDDRIVASNVVNVIDGGDGNDTFVFGSATAAHGDTIIGFETGDKIDLSGIDANAGLAGQQSFTLVTGQSATAPGQIVVAHEVREDGEYTVISGNTAGDDAAEFRISLSGNHTLTNSDFNL
ncbi:peroxidase family protein [Devosia rhizoryzae]|uniref:Heme peroxidase n=1 Tax=Devosia rhizoryzae TaxID=2774137 RepID=A0ABX7C4T9_9HYPH|nr:peroxidase family protein [Devosia rhizoryzae]QQR39259.1 hypothetical protein JI748_16285 [Devosia rhizoryzae]